MNRNMGDLSSRNLDARSVRCCRTQVACNRSLGNRSQIGRPVALVQSKCRCLATTRLGATKDFRHAGAPRQQMQQLLWKQCLPGSQVRLQPHPVPPMRDLEATRRLVFVSGL